MDFALINIWKNNHVRTIGGEGLDEVTGLALFDGHTSESIALFLEQNE